jgi:hypothetical protein
VTTSGWIVSSKVAAMAGATAIFGLLGAALPASHRNALPTPTPHPNAGPAIPLKSIDGLTSLTATATLTANGLINGERAQGTLTAEMATGSDGSHVSVSGPLLGPIAAQVGGSLVGLFTPSSVDIYRVPQGTYIVANSFLPVCIKPQATESAAALDELSPQNLMGMLTSSEVARGRLVGQETRNGRSVRHYVLDGDAFLAAARASADPKLRSFAESLWSAEDADLYVDAQGGYPVAFRGAYSGTYEPLAFEGEFAIQIDLTGVNTPTSVTLPVSCNRPIAG